jgi:O-antigen/teichoic acid export membrane protein
MPHSRRSFASRRRHTPLRFGATYGFLRPARRSEEETQRFLARLRAEPELQREVRASLVLQLVVVGILLAAMIGFVVQAALLLRRFPNTANSPLRWLLPAVAVLLAWAVARRFLRVLHDYRSLREP